MTKKHHLFALVVVACTLWSCKGKKTSQDAPQDNESAEPPVMVAGSWLYCGPANKELSKFGCAYLDADKQKHTGPIDGWKIEIIGPNREKFPIESYTEASATSRWNILFDIPPQYVGKIFDIEGTVTISGSPQTDISRGCPTGYILVPGDPLYNTKDFCIMKYEAKKVSGSETVQSTVDGEFAGGLGVGFEATRSSCQKVGQLFDLLTNDEWMTVATNIANTSANWSGGSVGKGMINRGHSDRVVGTLLNASRDEDPCFGTLNDHCLDRSHADWSQKRTHVLSNGEVIWDLSGNAKELVNRHVADGEILGSGTGVEYREYSNFSTDLIKLPPTDFKPSHATHPWWDDSWNSAQGIGRWAILLGNVTDSYFARGGTYDSEMSAGIFTVAYMEANVSSDISVGFRCAFHKPASL